MAKSTKKKKTSSFLNIDTSMSGESFLDTYIFGDDVAAEPAETYSTGLIPMDILLNGGICDGDNIMLYSAEGVGKSTICLQVIKKLIDLYDKKVLYLDVESGVSNQIGGFKLQPYIDKKSLIINDRIRTIGAAEKLLESILEAKELPFDVVVIDSITNLLDDSIFTRSVLDPMVAGQAKAMTAFLQKFKALMKEKGVTMFMINQERANLEAKTQYDRKTKSAGCKALHYIPDIIIRLKKGEKIEREMDTPNGKQKVEVGRLIVASADKNRRGNPAIPITFPLTFGIGISNVKFVTKLIKDKGYVKQAGAYFKTSIIPNPDGGEWSIHSLNGLAKFVDTNFEEINRVLMNDGAYKLIDELGGEYEDDDEA